MRTRILGLLVFALLLVPAAGTAGTDAAPRMVFHATTHTPKVNARWPWSIVVTTPAGRLLRATISVAIVDPIGGVHPVEYGCCKGKFITNVQTRGRFADYVQYPLSAKGYKLTFRVTVKTRLGTRVVNYWVKTR
ncbi:MAG: hypothetical protein ACM3QU_04420 [Verrucomicrobiota bacterium]